MKYDEFFREYDIRGIFGQDLNETSVKAIGLNLGREMLRRGAKNVSVGYDARLSAGEIFGWLVSGLNLAGVRSTISVCYRLRSGILACLRINLMQT